MPKIPPIDSNRLIKILERQSLSYPPKGSHVILINDEKTRIVLPMYPGKDLKPGLTRAILKEATISRVKFLKLLKEK